MQGRGVINFSADKPSHEFTTSTTEFDDALIQRGIVTMEQAIMAKGAPIEDAIRLAEEKRKGIDSVVNGTKKCSVIGNDNDREDAFTGADDSDDDSFDDDFDDDDFMKQYRQQRLNQLKLEQETKKASELSHSQPSSILHIDRDDWKEQVNKASMDRWVLVTMTEASGERRDRVVQELHRFAEEFCSNTVDEQQLFHDNDDNDSQDGHPHTQNPAALPLPKLLTIDASEAIPNWPAERVPAIFAYRNGVKQHEWIAERRGEFPPREILRQLFRLWSVI